jgi:hypothetical protein
LSLEFGCKGRDYFEKFILPLEDFIEKTKICSKPTSNIKMVAKYWFLKPLIKKENYDYY